MEITIDLSDWDDLKLVVLTEDLEDEDCAMSFFAKSGKVVLVIWDGFTIPSGYSYMFSACSLDASPTEVVEYFAS